MVEHGSDDDGTVAIVGLGYVGLPLAQAATLAHLTVVGYDHDSQVVDTLSQGRSHIQDISDDDLDLMLAQGLHVTNHPGELERAQVVIVCVPTPLDNSGAPDLGAVISAMHQVARVLHKDDLVVLESTTYPGTTTDVVRPILETSGLTAGYDFSLAFSPERVDPGNKSFGMQDTPKVVGGLTPRCTDNAVTLYGRFIDDVVSARGTREAEMAKLLENTYRHINIALVNELAQVCHELGIDIWNVIDCAATKPFGFQPFYPGPGVGGHCIPIDPTYLGYAVKSRLGYPLRFVELAQEINQTMPQYVYRRIQDALNARNLAVSGAHILLIGISYKPNLGDLRETPALPLAHHLLRGGAVLSYHDPFVKHWDVNGQAIERIDNLEAPAQHDLIVILQDHDVIHFDALPDSVHVLDVKGRLPVDAVERL